METRDNLTWWRQDDTRNDRKMRKTTQLRVSSKFNGVSWQGILIDGKLENWIVFYV